MLLKKLHPSVAVSAYFPNALPMQRLYDLCVSHQSQKKRHGLSYKAVFFSYATITGETFHCAKRLELVQEEGPAEGFFDKEPAPPPSDIQNLTAPPSSPGEPIRAGIFNPPNQAEDISLVRNQGLEVDVDMEPAPENVPSVDTPAAYTTFYRYKWGWDGIDCSAVAAQNQNAPSFKNGCIPQSLSYIDIFLHYLLFKWFIIFLLPSTSRDTKEADIAPLTLGDLLRYLCPPALDGRGTVFGVSPPLIRRQIHAPIASGNSCLNAALKPSLVNLG